MNATRFASALGSASALSLLLACQVSNPAYQRADGSAIGIQDGGGGGTAGGGVFGGGSGSGSVSSSGGVSSGGVSSGGGGSGGVFGSGGAIGTQDTSGVDLGATLDLTAGLVSHWKFDEPDLSMKATDSVGSGHGFLMNVEPSKAWIVGKAGRALSLAPNGTVAPLQGAVVTGPPAKLATMQTFTIAAFVRRTGGGAGLHAVVSRRSADNRGYGFILGFQNQNLMTEFSLAGTSYAILSTPTIGTGSWVHVALVAETTGHTLFLDGQDVGSSPRPIPPQGPGGQVYIGNAADSNGTVNQALRGDLDDLRIYERALPREAIRQLALGRGF